MERFPEVNWSDVVREAVKAMDEIALKARPRRSLAEVIREFRDKRRRGSSS